MNIKTITPKFFKDKQLLEVVATLTADEIEESILRNKDLIKDFLFEQKTFWKAIERVSAYFFYLKENNGVSFPGEGYMFKVEHEGLSFGIAAGYTYSNDKVVDIILSMYVNQEAYDKVHGKPGSGEANGNS